MTWMRNSAPTGSEQVDIQGRVHPPQSSGVKTEGGPAALVTGVNDPSSQDIEGVGGFELSFDCLGVGGINPAHDDVRM
jgi:hypothetical protein